MYPLKADLLCSYRKIFREHHFTFNVVSLHFCIVITVGCYPVAQKNKVKCPQWQPAQCQCQAWASLSTFKFSTCPPSFSFFFLATKLKNDYWSVRLLGHFRSFATVITGGWRQPQFNAFLFTWVQWHAFAAWATAYSMLMPKFTIERNLCTVV